MINTLDIIDVLWARANTSNLKPSLSGGIYKNRRPASSDKEDLVINSLPVNNEQLQVAVANVNIHVPDITVNVNNIQDRQPNHERLKILTGLAIPIFTDQWVGDYHYDVQQQTIIQDEEANSHYINIRIEFFNINISN
jgi:hypothetical protein